MPANDGTHLLHQPHVCAKPPKVEGIDWNATERNLATVRVVQKPDNCALARTAGALEYDSCEI